MLKKRVIFTLLFDGEGFVLSRNFRLQKIGNISWLQKNYNFAHVAFSVDEIIIINVDRGERNNEVFCENVHSLAGECFVPVCAGGGIKTVEDAKALIRSGADKILINTSLTDNRRLVDELVYELGSQCVVASIDAKWSDDEYRVFVGNGQRLHTKPLREFLEYINRLPLGEVYLNSMDKDGTGQGYDLRLLDCLPADFNKPLILAGGAGKYQHFIEALSLDKVDAVATAHLLNFVGNGLEHAREKMLDEGLMLAKWNPQAAAKEKNYFIK